MIRSPLRTVHLSVLTRIVERTTAAALVVNVVIPSCARTALVLIPALLTAVDVSAVGMAAEAFVEGAARLMRSVMLRASA